MKEVTYKCKIGTLTRIITLYIFEWGVRAIIRDKVKHNLPSYFEARNFKITKNYPTIDANIKRALKYYKYNKEI